MTTSTPCPCPPCVMAREYNRLRRRGLKTEALAARRLNGAKDYEPQCGCGRCVFKTEFHALRYKNNKQAYADYHRGWVARKRDGGEGTVAPIPARPRLLDRLDLIALRDPSIAKGRPPLHAN